MKIEIMLRSLNRFTNCVIVADKFLLFVKTNCPNRRQNLLFPSQRSLPETVELHEKAAGDVRKANKVAKNGRGPN